MDRSSVTRTHVLSGPPPIVGMEGVFGPFALQGKEVPTFEDCPPLFIFVKRTKILINN